MGCFGKFLPRRLTQHSLQANLSPRDSRKPCFGQATDLHLKIIYWFNLKSTGVCRQAYLALNFCRPWPCSARGFYYLGGWQVIFLRTVAKWFLEKVGPGTFKQHFAKLQRFNARVPTPFPPILCEATLLREKAGRHMLIPESCAWLPRCVSLSKQIWPAPGCWVRQDDWKQNHEMIEKNLRFWHSQKRHIFNRHTPGNSFLKWR